MRFHKTRQQARPRCARPSTCRSAAAAVRTACTTLPWPFPPNHPDRRICDRVYSSACAQRRSAPLIWINDQPHYVYCGDAAGIACSSPCSDPLPLGKRCSRQRVFNCAGALTARAQDEKATNPGPTFPRLPCSAGRRRLPLRRPRPWPGCPWVSARVQKPRFPMRFLLGFQGLHTRGITARHASASRPNFSRP